MKLSPYLGLYSNVYRKYRRYRGTPYFVFRFYMLGALVAFGGVCFSGLYPFQNIAREFSKSEKELVDDMVLNPFTKRTLEEMETDYYKDKKINDLTGYATM